MKALVLALVILASACALDHQGLPPFESGWDTGRCWTMYDPHVMGCSYVNHDGGLSHEICVRNAHEHSGWWCSGHRTITAPPCFICQPGAF